MPRKKKVETDAAAPKPKRTRKAEAAVPEPPVTGGMPVAVEAMLDEKESMKAGNEPMPMSLLIDIMAAVSEIKTGVQVQGSELALLKQREARREEEMQAYREMIAEMRKAVDQLAESTAPEARAQAEARMVAEIEKHTNPNAKRPDFSKAVVAQRLEAQQRLPWYNPGPRFMVHINGVDWPIEHGPSEVPQDVHALLAEMAERQREAQERDGILRDSSHDAHRIPALLAQIDAKYKVKGERLPALP